jgi:queuosine precursor transporter
MGTERKRQFLLGLFVMSLILANMLGAKVTAFDVPSWLAMPLNVVFYPIIWLFNQILSVAGNDPLAYKFFNTINVSVGILTVPLMFLITDVIEEVWGRKVTKDFVKVGVTAMLVMIVITWISVKLPVGRFAGASPDKLETLTESYNAFFSTSIRMAIASVIAFYLAQMHDIWAFNFWKKKTGGRFLWLRNNLSTVVSQFLDSTIFMFVAFYHPENFPAALVIKLVVPYYIFKILFALVDTPFVYLGVWWARRGDTGREKKLAKAE